MYFLKNRTITLQIIGMTVSSYIIVDSMFLQIAYIKMSRDESATFSQPPNIIFGFSPLPLKYPQGKVGPCKIFKVNRLRKFYDFLALKNK